MIWAPTSTSIFLQVLFKRRRPHTYTVPAPKAAMKVELDLPDTDSYSGTSCREVLLLNLADASYIGNYAHLRTVESAEYGIAQTFIKIQRLMQHALSLKSHRNTLIPIHKLPDDILVQIFSYITRRPNQYGMFHDEANWLAFSQVCGRWRSVATAAASLWTCPDFTKYELAQMMLERARRAPLSVILRNAFPHFALLFVGRHSIKEFKYSVGIGMQSGSSSDWGSVTSFLSAEFLGLKHVSLECGLAGSEPTINLDKLQAPNLQTFRMLHVCPSSWNIPVDNLTTFEWESMSSDQPVSQISILDLLRKTKKLKKLKLGAAIRMGDPLRTQSSTPDKTQTIELPFLRDLTLRDDTYVIERLVAQLHMPRLVHVNIHGDSMDEPAETLVTMSKISRHVVDSSCWIRVPVRHLEFDASQEGVGTIARGAKHSLVIQSDCYGALDYSKAEIEAYWQSFLSLFTLAEVTSFTNYNWHTKFDDQLSYYNFWPTISALPSVKSVSIIDLRGQDDETTADPALRNLLDTINSEVEMDASYGHSFPALQRITFQGLKMFHQADSTGSGRSWLDEVETLVQSRKQREMSLMIHMTDCYYTSESELLDLPEAITFKGSHIWDFTQGDTDDEAA